ncbi:adenylyltransferase/cytidyltransferase family protein, partial [Sneathia sp. DSM 16630]|nr:adenylyltransferase/cytidyltransferase family protein [Sneathia sp. DSM 16630]
MDRVAILGNFDGVHMGHQRLIKKAIDFAKKNGYETVVYTFSTLPNNK